LRFQQQCLQFAAGRDGRDVLDHLRDLELLAVIMVMAEMLQDALADIDAFADVQRLAIVVLEDIDARVNPAGS
jgi:hypothetical protein